ncbi:MAG: AAA family ATPase [Desulfovibrionaceae bacterium]|nr:AAA family ATPase [Desulfovibrionaceae bacterium]
MIDEQFPATIAKLPLTRTAFSLLRKQNQIYVDKTALIAKFAALDYPYFLARPRRFGKSLLIDTLARLFSNGLEDFKGLAIENLWQDSTYKVISIDFSVYGNLSAVKLNRYLSEELLEKTGFKGKISSLDVQGEDLASGTVLKKIAEHLPDRSYVLLIDEYDAPITHNLANIDELSKVTATLNNFYSAVKASLHKFRLIFITGVTRIAHLSIFSAFNNLQELTLDDDYATLLGITENEIRTYFHPYVERAAEILDMSVCDLYAALKNRYDGFRFAFKTKETIYNPWSLLNFLKNPKAGFNNYWFETGGTPSILMNFLKTNTWIDILQYKNQELYISKDELYAKSEPFNIPVKLLLLKAGYFCIEKTSTDFARISFPNSEVEESMINLYLSINNLSIKPATRIKTDSLINYIDNHDLKSIINLFNDILNDCASPKSKFFTDENTLRDLIFAVIPTNENIIKQKEREYIKGYSDLEFITRKTHFIIEFKRTYPANAKKKYKGRSAKKVLLEGIKQIKSRHYGEGSFLDRELYRVVLVISHLDKKILSNFSCEVED